MQMSYSAAHTSPRNQIAMHGFNFGVGKMTETALRHLDHQLEFPVAIGSPGLQQSLEFGQGIRCRNDKVRTVSLGIGVAPQIRAMTLAAEHMHKVPTPNVAVSTDFGLLKNFSSHGPTPGMRGNPSV